MLTISTTLILVGCSGTSQTTENQGCDAIAAGFERDNCLHDEISALSVEQVDVVIQKATTIEDAMVRGAAVSSWVAENCADVPREKGEELCQMLDGRDMSYCMRRLSSPHLQR